jgi:ketosteroid isomerase-like protein
MTERESRLRDVFAAFNEGDLGPVEALLTPDATWHGVEGAGFEGETAT